MSYETIKPALTPEQWGSVATRVMLRGEYPSGDGVERDSRDPDGWMYLFSGSWSVPITNDDRHALAAMCLYGRPFGFTQEDVRMLEWASGSLRHFGLKVLADRIAALLPEP